MLHKKINYFTYEIDENVINGSEAARIMYEIIKKDSNVTKFVFNNWGNGFADGIGRTLQQEFGIRAEFDTIHDTKQMVVFCPPSV